MGLAVEVGVLADLLKHDEEGAEWVRESLANANAVLAECGLPTHDEPEELPRLEDRSVLCSFPYSFLHYLRRVYAHWKQNPSEPIIPCSADENPADDPAVDEESCLFDSHLLCHSDCEGFYFPLQFSEIVIDETGADRIDGGLLGSSYRLAEELTALAPALGIELVDGDVTEVAIESIADDLEREADLWIERCVWLTLFEAARISIEHKTAIRFC